MTKIERAYLKKLVTRRSPDRVLLEVIVYTDTLPDLELGEYYDLTLTAVGPEEQKLREERKLQGDETVG